MPQPNSTWPLAFILAVGAQAAHAEQTDILQQPGVFAPGSLSVMANLGLQGGASSLPRLQRLIEGDRVVQFFPNFRNCITGTWRNC